MATWPVASIGRVNLWCGSSRLHALIVEGRNERDIAGFVHMRNTVDIVDMLHDAQEQDYSPGNDSAEGGALRERLIIMREKRKAIVNMLEALRLELEVELLKLKEIFEDMSEKLAKEAAVRKEKRDKERREREEREKTAQM